MALQRLVVLHSSDELYGADQVLLEVLDALPPSVEAEVWLPSDMSHPRHPLCRVLAERGVSYRHVLLPVLRRHYLHPIGLARLLARTARLGSVLARSRPDVVYCTTSAVLLGAPVARLARVPAVLGHIQEVWADGERRVLQALALSCHQLITISQTTYRALPARAQKRARVVENATREPLFLTSPNSGPGPVRYVVASRWTARKGYRTLLQAWDQADCPGHLVILGGPPSGPIGLDVPQLVSRLTDPTSVSLIGEVSDIGPYLSESDVVVMPSDDPEGFGLVPVEGFARARPALVSDAGGLRDLVTHGVDGWVFPAGDVQSLSSLLRSLDRRQAAQAGLEGRRTYERRFTAASYATRWQHAVLPWLGERPPYRDGLAASMAGS